MTLNTFFVYGTLRPGERRWSAISDYVQGDPIPAVLHNAVMYTTGSWPFIINTRDANDTIVGELVTFSDADLPMIIRMLDQIEGYYEGHPQASLFLRTQQLAVTGPESVLAYVYTGGFGLNESREEYAPIVSGDWKKRDA